MASCVNPGRIIPLPIHNIGHMLSDRTQAHWLDRATPSGFADQRIVPLEPFAADGRRLNQAGRMSFSAEKGAVRRSFLGVSDSRLQLRKSTTGPSNAGVRPGGMESQIPPAVGIHRFPSYRFPAEKALTVAVLPASVPRMGIFPKLSSQMVPPNYGHRIPTRHIPALSAAGAGMQPERVFKTRERPPLQKIFQNLWLMQGFKLQKDFIEAGGVGLRSGKPVTEAGFLQTRNAVWKHEPPMVAEKALYHQARPGAVSLPKRPVNTAGVVAASALQSEAMRMGTTPEVEHRRRPLHLLGTVGDKTLRRMDRRPLNFNPFQPIQRTYPGEASVTNFPGSTGLLESTVAKNETWIRSRGLHYKRPPIEHASATRTAEGPTNLENTAARHETWIETRRDYYKCPPMEHAPTVGPSAGSAQTDAQPTRENRVAGWTSTISMALDPRDANKAPAIDERLLADKVYGLIVNRVRRERELRGR